MGRLERKSSETDCSEKYGNAEQFESFMIKIHKAKMNSLRDTRKNKRRRKVIHDMQ